MELGLRVSDDAQRSHSKPKGLAKASAKALAKALAEALMINNWIKALAMPIAGALGRASAKVLTKA